VTPLRFFGSSILTRRGEGRGSSQRDSEQAPGLRTP
jgi:hypothetical protein